MSTDPLIGAVLGNYRIASLLSSGGMGSVYRAKHELLGRFVAIKFLRPELTESAELVQRFFNEAKAATAIQHPGIVEVYDFGYTDNGHAYYVMELLDGKPLSRAIAERGRFDEPLAVRVALGIASALDSAHARGIVHRDLKPDNIFLVPTGHDLRVKVLDFGIAKLANPDARHRTRTGVLLGTPKYMAPEQAREAARIDARADLYSLGCVLYEMLVGQPPFVAEGAGEIIAMQMFTEPDAPATRATVSPALDQLVMRLLAKEAADRPQTAAEVRELLGGRVSEPVIDTPLPIIEAAVPLTPMPVPRRSALPFVLAGLAVLVVGGATAWFATRSEEAVTKPPMVETRPIQPPAPVVESKPEVTKVTPTPAPAPVAAKKKPAAKSARIAKPAVPPDQKLTTDKNSPYEVDVGELRPPKAP